jgi:hypothetical protein
MQNGMHIGAIIDKDTVSAVTAAIIQIMAQRADQETIRHALSTFAQMASVKDISINNCNVSGDRKVLVRIDADDGTASIDNQADDGDFIE